jgi:hypothetical protein
MKTAALALVVTAALAGCGGGDGTITAPTVPEDGPLIGYSRSGGIAFSVQELEVNRDGTATLTLQEGTKPESRELALTDQELESLTEALEAVDPKAVDVETDVACADCYVYALTFPDGTELEFAEFPDPPSELEPLLTELNGIVEANSPPNPAGA